MQIDSNIIINELQPTMNGQNVHTLLTMFSGSERYAMEYINYMDVFNPNWGSNIQNVYNYSNYMVMDEEIMLTLSKNKDFAKLNFYNPFHYDWDMKFHYIIIDIENIKAYKPLNDKEEELLNSYSKQGKAAIRNIRSSVGYSIKNFSRNNIIRLYSEANNLKCDNSISCQLVLSMCLLEEGGTSVVLINSCTFINKMKSIGKHLFDNFNVYKILYFPDEGMNDLHRRIHPNSREIGNIAIYFTHGVTNIIEFHEDEIHLFNADELIGYLDNKYLI